MCCADASARGAERRRRGGVDGRTESDVAGQATAKKLQRLERALAASEAARRAADAELRALRRGAGLDAAEPRPMERCFSDGG